MAHRTSSNFFFGERLVAESGCFLAQIICTPKEIIPEHLRTIDAAVS